MSQRACYIDSLVLPIRPQGSSEKVMALEIKPLNGAFGGEVLGLNLAEEGAATKADIHKAWLKHGVLLFRSQRFSHGSLVEFSCQFGGLERNPASEKYESGAGLLPEVWIISNVVENGEPIGALGAGEAEWHTDMSYIAEPPMGSILYAWEVPDQGGNTWFLDMRAAYESLTDAQRRALEDRRANHSASLTSVGDLRKGATAPTDVTKEPGAKHPIVRTHPETGTKALYLGRRSLAYIEGLKVAKSEKLLDRLWEHCTQSQFMFEHTWRAGDLIMWDNRCVMHRRDPFDPKARRIMYRTQIKGDQPR